MKRFEILCAMLIVGLSTPAFGGVIADYQARTDQITHKALVSSIDNHPERWNRIAMKLHFRIDASGHIHDIRIVSVIRNPWAEETARRTLSALNLPPVPKELMRAAKMNGCNAEAQLIMAKTDDDLAKLSRDAKVTKMISQ
jgi:hypothetical protein